MATIKQKRLAKEIISSLNQDTPIPSQVMMERAGYGKGVSKTPKRAIESKGVQEELQVLGFSEEAAKGVVASILHHSDNDMARLKASDQIFKVLGSYAPEKRENVNLNLNAQSSPQEEEIAKKANEDLRKLYGEKS